MNSRTLKVLWANAIAREQEKYSELLQVVQCHAVARFGKGLGGIHAIFDRLGSNVVRQPDGDTFDSLDLEQVSAGIVCHQKREVGGAPVGGQLQFHSQMRAVAFDGFDEAQGQYGLIQLGIKDCVQLPQDLFPVKP